MVKKKQPPFVRFSVYETCHKVKLDGRRRYPESLPERPWQSETEAMSLIVDEIMDTPVQVTLRQYIDDLYHDDDDWW